MGPDPAPDWNQALSRGTTSLIPLTSEEIPPDVSYQFYGRHALKDAVRQSLSWMDKSSSQTHFPMAGISHDRAQASLKRFTEILDTATDRHDFARRIADTFTWYKSAGWDGAGGGVLFTGYYTPILEGSLTPDAIYRFPLYGLPSDLVKDEGGVILGQRLSSGRIAPYPDRATIEERRLLDGQGLELVWLKSPMDAYITHVNGSAVIRLPDGEILRLGYAGKNGREYVSLREQLAKDGNIDEDTGGLPAIRAWALERPDEVLSYLHRNPAYVFFTPIENTPHGSLNVPVTAKRTLATDKSLFPWGALTFVDTTLPSMDSQDPRIFRQFMLDQDTGGAIRTAGRADLYLGTGDEAENLAGQTRSSGQLYYLFLPEEETESHLPPPIEEFLP